MSAEKNLNAKDASALVTAGNINAIVFSVSCEWWLGRRLLIWLGIELGVNLLRMLY